MKTNLIVGAGQLGSRHLQGLLKYDQPQVVYVLDPSQEALDVAIERAKEIQHLHEVNFIKDWVLLPKDFDLVIIATNSNVREKVITELLTNHKVNFLILEKVLFPEISSYERISVLIKENHVKAWVNHPRRMFNSYREIKSMLSPGVPKIFQVTGGNWGLGCNGLHFVDLFLFLSGSKVVELDAVWVDKQILESKRKGFVEFSGTIKGRLHDNSLFQITSFKGEASHVTVIVFDTNDRYIIQEGATPQIYHLANTVNFSPDLLPFTNEFQSNLTTRLANTLFEKGSCELPGYEESRHTHEFFIKALLNKYDEITHLKNNKLPIT